MVDCHERETAAGSTSIRGDGDGGHGGEQDPQEGHHGREDRDRHGASHDHDGGHHAADLASVRAAVLTVSSSRTLDDDPSGDAIVESLERAGHAVATRELVADDLDGLQERVDSLVRRDDVDIVVATGGTGVSPDDVTVEAVEPLFEKRLPGFGELFRRRSEPDIGTRVVGTRATAGVVDDVPVFCLPGSEAAARLGVEEIIVPEVGHLAGLARRDEEP